MRSVARTLAVAAFAAIAASCASPSASVDPGPSSGIAASTVSPAVASTQPDAPEPAPRAVAPPTSLAPVTSTTPPRPTDPIDQHVAIGPAGAHLHITCAGQGPNTIVLIAGFGDSEDSWDAVAPTLSEHTRVCSYARFGTGSSDPPPTLQTFTAEADDLHTLLHGVGELGPYVVVGHSFGGAEAVAFTNRFSDEVHALLLLDASPVDWPAAVCAVPDDGSDAAAGFRQTCAMISDPASNPEHLAAADAFAEVAAITSLSDVPLVVATAAQHPRPGLDPAAATNLDEAWTRGQQHWAALSTSAELIAIPDTGHYIQFDRPTIVVDTVLRLAT